MPTDANRPDRGRASADDEAALDRHALALTEALAVHVGPWLRETATGAATRAGLPAEAIERVRTAADQHASGVVDDLRSLLATDIDDQRANPLAVLRSSTRVVTDALRAEGAEPVDRDEGQAQMLPDDVYDLAPATWADVHPDLQGLGITWSAAKAFVFKARRRAEGRR